MELGLLPHRVEPQVPLPIDVVATHELHIERPNQFGDEQPRLHPGNATSRARSRSLTKGREALLIILVETRLIVGVILR